MRRRAERRLATVFVNDGCTVQGDKDKIVWNREGEKIIHASVMWPTKAGDIIARPEVEFSGRFRI
jgi:hypothetical protein